MLVRKKNLIYSNKIKYVQGSGFIDYISQNKDLIIKPLLTAVSNIGAMALTEGSKHMINKLIEGKTKKSQLDEKSKQIISELVKEGTGIKKF